MTDGESASAARGNARLVCDFEPGSVTVASTGREAVGAGHNAVADDGGAGWLTLGWFTHRRYPGGILQGCADATPQPGIRLT